MGKESKNCYADRCVQLKNNAAHLHHAHEEISYVFNTPEMSKYVSNSIIFPTAWVPWQVSHA